MSDVVSIHSARTASTVTPSTAAAPTSGEQTRFSAAPADASKRPEGEKGHFINRTGNPRDSEDFQIVQRGGRTFHVYDSAKDHTVYELPHAAKAATGKESDSGGTPAA